MPQPTPAAPVSRRRALAGLAGLTSLGLLGLAGCRWGPDEEIDGVSQQEVDADRDLLAAARRDVAAQRDLADRTARQHVGLSPALAPLVALHDAHLALLGKPSPDDAPNPSGSPSPTAPVVAADSATAYAAVRTAEVQLQAALAQHAGTATSGTLARALASMSAAVAQHVAVLPAAAAQGPA